MDLTTKHLGMEPPHPLVPSSARPLAKDLAALRRLEEAGAAAVVVHSLLVEHEDESIEQARGPSPRTTCGRSTTTCGRPCGRGGRW